jgi:eukaryotic-like serine/threonine-protein kinase
MVAIDGTRFEIGSRPDDPLRGFGDIVARDVAVGGFCVDIFEFPNQRGKLPTTSVSWKQAKQMCESRGKRLCSEEEWELACKGPRGVRFPFGNQFDAEICNAGADGGKLQPAGVFGRCRSGFGVVDMSGNAAEWTSGRWSDDIADRVVKGGAADQAFYTARCAARANESATGKQGNLGFRCCSDP